MPTTHMIRIIFIFMFGSLVATPAIAQRLTCPQPTGYQCVLQGSISGQARCLCFQNDSGSASGLSGSSVVGSTPSTPGGRTPADPKTPDSPSTPDNPGGGKGNNGFGNGGGDGSPNGKQDVTR